MTGIQKGWNNSMTKTLHIIPHSHWDREWYMSFEKHRTHLVDLMDSLIKTMEENPDYTYFHLDGQYIVIEDYLEIRPHMRDRLFKLIRDDRIQIGPWYILQDEYLTSGEANVRNLLYGLRLCRETGAKPVMCGYFPDAFGNISQAPQLLAGFGIDNAAFGRGIGEIQFDNQIVEGQAANPSELIWRAPDGSEVIGVMFTHWYHNAMELPAEPEALKERLETLISSTDANACTPHLLGMNGCDHQPVQTDLPQVLEIARKLYEGQDMAFRQSNFKDYLRCIRPYKDKFPVLEGELNGQNTNGVCLLINTASTHVPLKQLNDRAQNTLERISEPLNLLSCLHGDEYRSDFLLYSWKTLMQNHPHDSICTCSDDAVAEEMATRFHKAIDVAESVRDEAADYLVSRIDTSAGGDRNLVLFHLDPGESTSVVTAYVDFDLNDTPESIRLTEMDGTPVPCIVTPLGKTFTFTLPKDSFRKSARVNRFRLQFPVTAKGVGWRALRVERVAADTACALTVSDRAAENETLRMVIEADGSLTLTDKQSGKVWPALNRYIDQTDIGNGYNFVSDGSPDVTTAGQAARISIAQRTPFSVTFAIENSLTLPAGLDDKRTQTVELPILTRVTLTQGIHRVDIETSFRNEAENHRLRALFAPDIHSETVFADGQFDLVERPVRTSAKWTNPSNDQRCQAFFAMADAEKGLAVAEKGLHEYEVLRDGSGIMALTLLRSVGEVGDWGDFPTPKMQCKGDHTVCYSLIPYLPEQQARAFADARAYHAAPVLAVATAQHTGCLPAAWDLLSIDNDLVQITALKKAEERGSALLRVYNTSSEPQTFTVAVGFPVREAYLTNLAEDRLEELAVSGGALKITAGVKKIVTIELVPETAE